MRPITVTVGPLATASANNICLSQSVSGAGSFILNGTLVSGGVAKLDTPRRVLITSAGNDSAVSFTITGTTYSNSITSEVILGSNASSVYTITDFLTISSIKTSASTASTVTIGTNGIAGSPWVSFDPWSTSYISIQAVVSGTVNYTIQQTTDDPNSADTPISVQNVTWVNSNDTAVVGATTTQQSNYIFTPIFARVLLNSGSGSVRATFVQSGVVTL
jgi:hypothetical protein